MTKTEILDQRYDLAFRADFSTRYHRRRAAFLIKLDRLLTLITLMSGAGAFLAIVDQGSDSIGKLSALTVTIVSLFQIVFELGVAGAKHTEWLRRWDKLATDIQCNSTPSEEQLVGWQQERSSIETECVGELRALSIDCENAARQYLGVKEGQRKIGRFQRLTMQFGTFQIEFPQLEYQIDSSSA